MKIQICYRHRGCSITADVDSPEEILRVLNAFPPEAPHLPATLGVTPAGNPMVATRVTEDQVQHVAHAAIETATQPDLEAVPPAKEKAPKVAKAPKGKTLKADAPEAPKTEKTTREEVTAAMMALCDRASVADAKALLGEFNVARAGELTPEQYGPFVAAANARGV